MDARIVLIHNYAKKLKSRARQSHRKRYFALTTDSENSEQSRLEIFENESKWRLRQHKRLISLSDLFKVEEIFCARVEFGLAVYMESGSIYLIFSSEEDRKRWKDHLEGIAYRNRKRNDYPQIEQAWQAIIRFKPSESSIGPYPVSGVCRVCFTKSEIIIFNVSLIKPDLVIQYPYIRHCLSKSDSLFRMELGRGAPTGACSLNMHMMDEVEAKCVHSKCMDIIQNMHDNRNNTDIRRSRHDGKSSRRQSGIESESAMDSSNIRSSHSISGTARSSFITSASSEHCNDMSPFDEESTFSTGETIKFRSMDSPHSQYRVSSRISSQVSNEYLPMELSVTTPTRSSAGFLYTAPFPLPSATPLWNGPPSDTMVYPPSAPASSHHSSMSRDRSEPSTSIHSHSTAAASVTGDQLLQQEDNRMDRVLHYLSRAVHPTSPSPSEQQAPSSPLDIEFPKRANSLGARPLLSMNYHHMTGPGGVDPAVRASPNPPSTNSHIGCQATTSPSNRPAEEQRTELSNSTPQLLSSKVNTPLVPGSSSQKSGLSSSSLSKASISSEWGSTSHRDDQEIFMEMCFDRPRTCSDSSKYRQRATSFTASNVSPAAAGHNNNNNIQAIRSRVVSAMPQWFNNRRSNQQKQQRSLTQMPDRDEEREDDEYMEMGGPQTSIPCEDNDHYTVCDLTAASRQTTPAALASKIISPPSPNCWTRTSNLCAEEVRIHRDNNQHHYLDIEMTEDT